MIYAVLEFRIDTLTTGKRTIHKIAYRFLQYVQPKNSTELIECYRCIFNTYPNKNIYFAEYDESAGGYVARAKSKRLVTIDCNNSDWQYGNNIEREVNC